MTEHRARLEGKVAIVTGAGQGVGRGIARALATSGAAVTVAGRTLEKVERTAAEIAATGGRALAVRADVTETADVTAMVHATRAAFGTIDILVNNAQATGNASIEDLTEEDAWRDLSTGPLATLRCIQACLPSLKERGGTIINLGSTSAITGNPGFGAYTMAKEAVRGLTRVAARELGPHGITVNVICPMADSPASDAFLAAHPEHRARLLAATPLGRMGRSEEDIGRACVSLASEDLGYLTGATLVLDGGRTMLT